MYSGACYIGIIHSGGDETVARAWDYARCFCRIINETGVFSCEAQYIKSQGGTKNGVGMKEGREVEKKMKKVG